MDNTPESSGHGQRNKRCKSRRTMVKPKKRKSQTTPSFRANEAEVQKLLSKSSSSSFLDNTSSNATPGSKATEEEGMDEYFYSSSAKTSTPRHSRRKRVCSEKDLQTGSDGTYDIETGNTTDIEDCNAKYRSRMKQWQHYDDGDDNINADSDGSEENEEETQEIDNDYSEFTRSSNSGGQSTKQNTTSSTFIEIEFDEQFVLPGLQRKKHHFDDESLLYRPSAKPNLQLKLVLDKLMGSGECSYLKPYTIRMLNRFYEQAKSYGEKVDEALIKAFLDNETAAVAIGGDYVMEKKLYRSICDYKFKPIFISPSPNLQQLPDRKFIRIYMKHLRFTEHQNVLEEHRKVNELTDLYELYTSNVSNRICEKLWMELMIERKILMKLNAKTDQCTIKSSKRHTQEMDHHLEQVQQLRSSYFEAEAHQKSLIKYILEKWADLKLLRKDQQFQCTRFQLRLHVEQPQDIAGGYANVKEHFDQDLSEMYRERLELFYTEKRKWNRRKSSGSELKPPRKPNIDRLREELKTQYAKSFYEPEEPRVQVLRIHVNKAFLYQNLPTPNKKLKTFYMKIYFDEQFVGQTRSYRLEPDLHLYMNESMGILLERHMPKKIIIVLFEKSILTKDKKLATVEMTLMEGQKSHKLHFIGSECAGDLYLNLSLEEEEQPDKLQGSLFGDIRYMIKTMETRESEELHDYCDDENASGEDCLNDTYITSTTDIFEENLIQFCDINEMLNNKRFRLLRSRYEQNDPRTKNLRFIPSFEHEISFDWEAETDPVVDPGNWMDPIDLHKHSAKKFMKKTYETVNTHCARMAKLMENTENLLIGDEQATWSGLFSSLFSIFKTPRPLHGACSLKTLGPPQCLTPEDVQTFNIVLNVVRATGIPVRSRQMFTINNAGRSSDSSSNMLNSNMFISQTLVYSNVRPFIVLSYKDKQSRSSTVEGSNPTWNEQLILSIKGKINELCDDLKIILYDEIIEQQYANDDLSARSMDVYQRVQTNWLGEYRVPISSLIVNQKFDGCFELTVPKVIVGYKRPTISSVTNVAIESYPEMKEAVHLWCYLSIEPKVELPRLLIRSLECSELNEIRLHLQQCSMEMKQLQPTRYVDPLVCTVTGQRVCLTRLLEPVPIIDGGIGEPEQLIDIACRFVSLQSVYKSYDACLGFEGLWLDNKTVLDNAWCSAKDLGVLLCNYFLALDIRCWLVLGLAAPYGECTFVLYRQPETGELLLIAPHTGKRYTTKDVQCPLSRVSYIIAKDNIYLNIQSETRVAMTNFNLHDGACWLSTFNKRNPAPSGDVQELEYTYNQTGNINQLRKNIERKVMKKINAWRPMRRTMWNRAFQPQLLSILLELEYLAMHTSNSNYEEPKFSEQLENEFPGYRIFGFTLNFPYTNLKSISELIRSTGIHLNNDRSVEFSLAVHIHPYPNNVLSCWIFLISVIPF